MGRIGINKKIQQVQLEKEVNYQLRERKGIKHPVEDVAMVVREALPTATTCGWKPCGRNNQSTPISLIPPDPSPKRTMMIPPIMTQAQTTRITQMPMPILELQTETSMVTMKLQLCDLINNPWRNYEVTENLRKALLEMTKDLQALLEYQYKVEKAIEEPATPWNSFAIKAACRTSFRRVVETVNASMVYQVNLEKQHSVMEAYYTAYRRASGGLLAQAKTSDLITSLTSLTTPPSGPENSNGDVPEHKA